jgi:hypothetical protein
MQIGALIGLIKQRKQEIAQSMIDGHCVNFESYQRLVGQCIGLNEALEFINNLLEEERRDVE